MIKYEANAVNFSYLLLEYYKLLNLTENEVVVILMIDHLLTSQNEFITTDLLTLKMQLSESDIDNAMASLLTKKHIEYLTENDKVILSIEPIKKTLYSHFQRSIFSEQELSHNEEKERLRSKIYILLEKEFSRALSPLEHNHVDQWIRDEVDEDIIVNSIKDAVFQGKFSITYIDRLILRKINEKDG